MRRPASWQGQHRSKQAAAQLKTMPPAGTCEGCSKFGRPATAVGNLSTHMTAAPPYAVPQQHLLLPGKPRRGTAGPCLWEGLFWEAPHVATSPKQSRPGIWASAVRQACCLRVRPAPDIARAALAGSPARLGIQHGHLLQDCKLWLLVSSANPKCVTGSTPDSEMASQKLRRTHSMLA